MRIPTKGRSPLWMMVQPATGDVLYVATDSAHHARQKARAQLGTGLTNADLQRMGYVAVQVITLTYRGEVANDQQPS